MKNMKQNGMRYFSNSLKIALGAGAALGGSYLVSRVKNKQESETSLSRLEQMLEELLETKANTKTTAKTAKK